MNQPPELTVIDGGKPDPFANPPTVLTATHDPPPEPLTELAIPRTASEAFVFLSVRAAEHFAANPSEKQWALISEVFQKLAEFTSAFPYAAARHVRWGYATVFKRVPQAQSETGPMVKWMAKIPACAPDKAAPAALLWHYLASCAGKYAASLPVPRGKPGAWEYMQGELTIPCSNEQAYALGQQRHFWSSYQGRLLYVVGVLLQEMAGVPVPTAPKAADPGPAGASTEPGPEAVSEIQAASETHAPVSPAAALDPAAET